MPASPAATDLRVQTAAISTTGPITMQHAPPVPSRLPNRQSIRLSSFDYTRQGAYFITICTDFRRHHFGEIQASVMELSEIGAVVQACWDDLPNHHSRVQLDAFQIMPNHVHAVLWLTEAGTASASMNHDGFTARPHGPAAGSVAAIVGSLKSAVSRRINQMRAVQRATVWQRNYFEHVIRDQESLLAIRHYVQTNPQRWELDKENTEGARTDDVEAWVKSLTAVREDVDDRTWSGVGALGSEGAHDPEPRATQASHPTAGTRATQASHPTGGTRATQVSPLRGGEQRSTPPSKIVPRIGHGYDLHRLQSGGRLVLGGVEVARDISPIAHSDGDVVLHAVVDALLGAIGMGDIGELFPNTDPRWKDAPSRVFVEEAMRRMTAAGYAVGNIDITILAERPKLKPFKPAIAASVADLLRSDASQVNVKAGTNEGCDAIGRGEAIAAHAVVLLVAVQ